VREYNPKDFEKNTYNLWENNKFFETDYSKEKNFCIMMPPPNVTGKLHIGHALTFTLQDIIVRYKRMDGYATLWQPGTDHAGIATQNVVEKQILAEGKTKEEIGLAAGLLPLSLDALVQALLGPEKDLLWMKDFKELLELHLKNFMMKA